MTSTELKTPVQPRRVEFAKQPLSNGTELDRLPLVEAPDSAERAPFATAVGPASTARTSLGVGMQQGHDASTLGLSSSRTPARNTSNTSAADWSVEGTPSAPETRSWHRNWGGYGRFQRQRLSPLDSGYSTGPSVRSAGGRAPPNTSWLDTETPVSSRLGAGAETKGPALARGLFTPGLRTTLDADRSSPLQESELACWVTVFGFAPGQQSQVLRELRSFGPVLEHRLRKGNWMHVRYESPLQAQAACSRSSRLLNDVTMIGIVPCTEPETILHEYAHKALSDRVQSAQRAPATTLLSQTAASMESGQKSWISAPNRSQYPETELGTGDKPALPPAPKRSLLGRLVDTMLNW